MNAGSTLEFLFCVYYPLDHTNSGAPQFQWSHDAPYRESQQLDQPLDRHEGEGQQILLVFQQLVVRTTAGVCRSPVASEVASAIASIG